MPSKIDSFATAFKTLCNNYKINPKVYLFALGKSQTRTDKNNNLIQVYDLYESKANSHGWTFYDIHDTWQGASESNYVGNDSCTINYNDTTHPNTTGLMAIGSTVASYLKYDNGRLYNPPAGYEFRSKYNTDVSSTIAHGNSGFYLSNRPENPWAIEIGAKAFKYDNVGGSTTLNRPFMVSREGTLWAQNAHIAGTINATSGSIAGFKIGKSNVYSNALYKTTQSDDGKIKYEVGMKGSEGNTDGAFYIRSSTDNWATSSLVFYVRNNGELYSTAGTIGGWTIDDTQFKTGEANTKNAFYISSYSNGAGNWIKAYDDEQNVTFRVSKTGYLYATGATITGTINATSGNFSDGITIGGTSVTAANLRKLYSYATGGSGTPITRVDVTKGSIDFDKYFSVSDSGAAQMSNDNGGFLTLGGTTTHPYVSSLNVACSEGAITFRTGTKQSDIGVTLARIGAVQDDMSEIGYSLKIATGYNIWINKHKCISGQVKVQTGLTTSVYLAFNRGFLVGISDAKHSGFEMLN